MRVNKQSTYHLFSPHVLAALLPLGITCIFLAFPTFDYTLSALWGNTNGFFLAGKQPWVFIDSLNIIFPFVPFVWILCTPSHDWILSKKRTIFVYVVFAVVIALLIVNGLLKEYIPRSRPSDLVFFGGHHIPYWALSLQGMCITNCSFPSGHAVSAWLALTPFWLSKKNHLHWIIFCTCAALIVGFTRIVQGRHFISDVFTSLSLVVVCAYVLRSFLLKTQTKIPPNPK